MGGNRKVLGERDRQSRGKQAAGAGGCAVTEETVFPAVVSLSILTDDGLDSPEHLSKRTNHAECQVFYNDFSWQLTLKEIGLITTFTQGKENSLNNFNFKKANYLFL